MNTPDLSTLIYSLRESLVLVANIVVKLLISVFLLVIATGALCVVAAIGQGLYVKLALFAAAATSLAALYKCLAAWKEVEALAASDMKLPPA